MTQWILNRACADLARLQRDIAHGEGIRVSVNVSSRYLNHGNIVEDVRNGLATHQLAPDCLILEVTESLLLENSERLERTFQELKRIGVRLALDDFGTGYSSLAYLHRFPIDILKIDRSFVERLAGEREGAGGVDAVALARAILSLADALGLDTVAEGIEHDSQRDTLLELGCKTGQGYSVRQGHAGGRSAGRRGDAPPKPARRQRARPDRILGDRPVPRDHRERLTPVSAPALAHYITPRMVLIIRLPAHAGRRLPENLRPAWAFDLRRLV